MKFSLLTLLLASQFSFANPQIERLICNDGGPAHQGTVRATLDASSFTPGSGHRDMTTATVYYNFSTVNQMVCEGIVRDNHFDVDCVGFYVGREVTKVLFRSENGKIVAHWQTSRPYGNEPRVSECRFEP